MRNCFQNGITIYLFRDYSAGAIRCINIIITDNGVELNLGRVNSAIFHASFE